MLLSSALTMVPFYDGASGSMQTQDLLIYNANVCVDIDVHSRSNQQKPQNTSGSVNNDMTFSIDM